jgi:hypothetical protein
MSTAGQVVGGLVGGVVGFFNPALGWQIGAQAGIMLGGLLDPPKGSTIVGPRLSDLTVQTSTYGAVIPRVYGTVPIVGNVFWLENNRIYETVVKKKSGGKGGSKTKTKTYVNYATFAVGLCKGPIVGVKRIWIKGELFYDAGSSDPATIAASNTASTGFSVYLGTDTQMPDTRMQATLGAANTPAYRGLAYIVFNDLPLAKYGETIAGAQVKAEVVTAGNEEEYFNTAQVITDRYWQGCAWDGAQFCAIARNTHTCATSPDGVTWTEHAMPVLTTEWLDIYGHNGLFIALGSYSGVCSSSNGLVWKTQAVAPVSRTRAVAYGQGKYIIATENGHFFQSLDGKVWAAFVNPAEGVGYGGGYHQFTGIAFNGVVWVAIGDVDGKGWRFFTSETGDPYTWEDTYAPGSDALRVCSMGARFCVTSSWDVTYTSDDGYNWAAHTGSSLGTYGGNCLTTDGRVFLSIAGSRQSISPDGVAWTNKEMPGPPSNTWNGLSWNGAVFAAVRNYTGVGIVRAATIQPYRISSENVELGHIVESECLASGILTSGDIDVTALTAEVRGYTVASQGSIRGALSPLQAAWPFDVLQSGYGLRFVPRGSSSIMTIPTADMDARGDGTSPGVQVTISREMDTQLPRRMIIKHVDYDREFDVGEQYAERLNTDAVNEETQELAIVMTSAEAAGKAEVLLYVRWLERFDISFNLPPTYNNLEPADVVTLETPEGNALVRLTAINYTSDGRLECKGKFASQAVYTPAALGVSPVVTGPTTIASAGASDYVLLDVPYLHTAQADPSFLAAMYGVSAGWPGGVLIRTDDAGTTWNDLQAFDPPGSDVGVATNTISTVDSRVWDKASSLSVTMLNGSLSSTTELAVLNGENYFAYGDEGRWEIIGVQNCVLVSGKSYTLYDMLRGRAGTEWAMSTHQIGDKLVSLSLTDVTAIGMATATIGLSREYRGITYGNDIDTDVDFPFAYTGVNLECLSPVYVRGYKTVATNDWNLEWVRRSRTDGEWRDMVDAGLSETSEAYEVDIFADGTFATVKRTIAAATQSCTYTSAQQVTDFGSNQATIYIKVYQLSSVVGRGYPATATIS